MTNKPFSKSVTTLQGYGAHQTGSRTGGGITVSRSFVDKRPVQIGCKQVGGSMWFVLTIENATELRDNLTQIIRLLTSRNKE